MKQGAKILIVDDEPMVRQSIKMMLKFVGYEAEAAENGQTALAMLSEKPFDLVITDYSMPDLRGDQLVAQIRERFPDQKIIMATAFVEEYKVFGQPSTSINALLTKPFSIEDLTKTVEQVLSQESPGLVSTGYRFR
jgi:CheY-like chemotaxis protein